MRTSQFLCIDIIDHEEARRRYIVLLVILILLVLSLGLLSTIPKVLRQNFGVHPLSFCPFLNATGVPCPLCGLTRSLFSLLAGNLPRALWYHPFGPAFWGGGVLLGIFSFTFTLLRRKVSLKLSRGIVVASIAVVTLVAWYSNILYGHH